MGVASRKNSTLCLFLMGTVFALTSAACRDTSSQDFSSSPELDVDLTLLNFDSGMTDGKTFEIHSNTSWSLSCDADWCSVTPTSGSGNATVLVLVAQNNNNVNRSATVDIKAGARSKKVTVLQSFGAIPIISSFSPLEAAHGEKLVIRGANFSLTPSENSVTLNGIAAQIVSVTPTEISVTVPKDRLCTGPVEVSVNGKTVVSAIPFTYVLTATVSTLAGSNSGFADGTGIGAQFNYPIGITIDTQGENLYVADSDNHRIRKISIATGAVETLAGSNSGFADGIGISAQFNYPIGITIDTQGENLYVADSNNHRIRKISITTGAVKTLAGSNSGFADGDGLTQARFDGPQGITIDADGNLYVADFSNNRIRKVTPTGVVSTFAGSGIRGFVDGFGAPVQFSAPSGITIDTEGNLYVADMNNHRIRKISPQAVVSTFVGSNQGHLDGANTAQFGGPRGVAIDLRTGTLYVADTWNNRIRKVVVE